MHLDGTMNLDRKRTCFFIGTNNRKTASSWNILQATITYFIVIQSNKCIEYIARKQLENSTTSINNQNWTWLSKYSVFMNLDDF